MQQYSDKPTLKCIDRGRIYPVHLRTNRIFNCIRFIVFQLMQFFRYPELGWTNMIISYQTILVRREKLFLNAKREVIWRSRKQLLMISPSFFYNRQSIGCVLIWLAIKELINKIRTSLRDMICAVEMVLARQNVRVYNSFYVALKRNFMPLKRNKYVYTDNVRTKSNVGGELKQFANVVYMSLSLGCIHVYMCLYHFQNKWYWLFWNLSSIFHMIFPK